MIMKKLFPVLIIGVILLAMPFANLAQIRVFESEKSDSTKYSNSSDQDTVFIVYKGEYYNNTITMFADLNNIDSLDFDWYKFNKAVNGFELFRQTDIAKTDTVFFGTIPGENMNNYEGCYRVNIHNLQKGIDTTFTIWLWYQGFFINSISIYSSTCDELVLVADTSFQDIFTYYDLSVDTLPALRLENKAIFTWTIDPIPDSDSGRKYGVKPRFSAPFVPTTYTVYGTDLYGFVRERTININEIKMDNKGYPYLRAVNADFSGIHGVETNNNKRSDTVIVEAPYGVWFFNESKNAKEFEWVFYNHEDWRTGIWDTTLFTTENFEPIDSIYYQRPPRDTLYSAKGYDVKLTVTGPIYNNDNEVCSRTVRKENFVIVKPTKFPKDIVEMPNVFTPNATNNNYFYFLKSNLPKSIKYFSVKIYNRWGNKIYEYEDSDGSWQEPGESKPGWNGTTRVGTKAKAGVYYYAIIANGWNGEEFKVGGFVHIFR